MSDLLSGLSELLGGFAAKNQIDKSGFDWREKLNQAEFQRQQDQLKAQQANEKFATDQLAQAAVAAPEGADLSSLIPANIKDAQTRARIMAVVPGAAAQQKSALANSKAEADLTKQGLVGAQHQSEIAARGKVLQDLMDAREQIRQNQELSPADRSKLLAAHDLAIERVKLQQAGANQRSQAGGKPQLRLIQDPNDPSKSQWAWVQPGQTAPGAPTMMERQRGAQAETVISQAEHLIQDYQTPEARAAVGGATGYLNEKQTTNPIATMVGQAFGSEVPPTYMRVRAEEASLSALQGILHGNRGGENMLRHFEDNIRGNPAVGVDQRAAAVQALIDVAKRIQEQGKGADTSDLEAQMYSIGQKKGGVAGALRAPRATQHGAAVARRSLPDGRTQYRDANGVTWEE